MTRGRKKSPLQTAAKALGSPAIGVEPWVRRSWTTNTNTNKNLYSAKFVDKNETEALNNKTNNKTGREDLVEDSRDDIIIQ